MKKNVFLFLVIALVFFSCKRDAESISKKNNVISESNSNSPQLLQQLHLQVALTDTMRVNKEYILEVFAKELGKAKLSQVFEEQWPDSLVEVYNIWKDGNNEVRMIGRYPYSETGDWFIGHEHYFDNNRKTFAYRRSTHFYNSLCTDGVANETILHLFNDKFKEVNRAYQLLDEVGRKLNKEECDMIYDTPYEVSPTLEHFEESIF